MQQAKVYQYVGTNFPGYTGEYFTLRQWVEIEHKSKVTILHRIQRNGGVITDARPWGRKYQYIGNRYPHLRNGIFTVSEFARRAHLSKDQVLYRIKGGVIGDLNGT